MRRWAIDQDDTKVDRENDAINVLLFDEETCYDVMFRLALLEGMSWIEKGVT
jgi:hypothetical protein